ncbi:MAG: hypothetical protein K2H01_10120 [Ruminococcus sp.]|nr:hypothetical protein [Ruminococcus sp.]
MRGNAGAALAFVCCAFFLSKASYVSAEGSYSYNFYGEAVPSQAGYRAVKAVNGNELGCGELSQPADIFCADSGSFFIADKGNDRIIEVDPDFTKASMVYSIFTDNNGASFNLSSPEGIFVSDDGLMYISDTGNSRIIVSDMDGNVSLIVTKPDSDMYESETFRPEKVIADKYGNIYAILDNITGGAAFFSRDGEFEGYYGAGSVLPTAKVISDYIKKLFATDKMRSAMSRSVPAGITGFDIDKEGFVYTVTGSADAGHDRVKKVNPAGKNLFAGIDTVFGDLPRYQNSDSGEVFKTELIDIDVDNEGRICCLDTGTGRVFQYNKEGSLLFIMGGRSDCLGGFSLKPTAVECTGERIFITDSMKNTVTIFEETDFGKIVHDADKLYNDGKYEEALKPWQEALRCDGNYTAAYLGISSALLRKGDYRGAMEYAELGGSSYHYNKAFEGYRAEWLSKNFSIVSAFIAVFIILRIIHRHYRKKLRRYRGG